MSAASESFTSPRAGEVLAGKYRVEGVLGRGGMGLVLAATHLHLGERVAIKLLLPGTRVSPAAFERFLREGRAAARIKSEHVARVHDAGILDTGEPYLVLEHLDGLDLRTLLRERGRVPVDDAVAYVLQACEVLAEAHALGIVHRDLKPANLFLTRRADGSAAVKVIDFGISKIMQHAPEEGADPSSLTERHAAIGTPSYMAPEQMRSARDADARADIWSLGAVLYGLTTGSPPFPGETMIDVYDRILGGAPSLRAAREDAPIALDAIVSRCLSADPSKRYQTVGELAEALAEISPPGARISADRAIRITRSQSNPEGARGVLAPASERTGEALEREAPTTIEGATISVAPGSDRSMTEGLKEPSWGPSARPAEAAAPPAEASRAAPPRDRGTKLLLGIGVTALAIGAMGGRYVWPDPPREAPRSPPSAPADHPTPAVEVRRAVAPSASASSTAIAPSASASATPVPVRRSPTAAPRLAPTARALPKVPGFAETPD